MAEVRNNFLKSRMNRDLDARLVPSGEYREAFNVMISKSEGDDVGALENVLGNLALNTWGADYADCNISIIGKYMDVVNDRIIVFMTNFVDTSGDNLSNFASADSLHAIGVHHVLTGQSQVIVSGRFLNFSKTQEVYGVNLIEDLLFWTDNRNQPRKINLTTAIADNTYYQSEDNISVAKIYPYQPILLYKEEVVGLTITQAGAGDGSVGSGFTVVDPSCKTTTISGSGSGMTVNIDNTAASAVTAVSISEPGTGYANGDVIQLIPRNNPVSGTITQQCQVTIVTGIVSTMQDVVSETLPDGTSNPLYNKNWPGDEDYLKDKFASFSYRFKFDDDEYSLIAPFTQACFVPKQDGYFIGDDEDRTFKSTEVSFMENKINNILLQIPTPSGNAWSQVGSDLNIVEMDILMKLAGETSIRVVDTVSVDVFNLSPNLNYEYEYQSLKPYKVLPDKELTRVFDQVPVRALAQEVSANRVIYGNFIDKPTPPIALNYNVSADTKDTLTLEKEYQNHTLKQNRNYQVGVVLSDRYGRQSTTLLSEIDTSSSSTTLKGSTLFHPFKESPFSTYPNTNAEDLLTSSDTWPGDSLKVTFIDQILSDKSSATGAPGLYDATTNPLGWYSYKIVVKQQQQDYYNVYFPGILNGYINGDMKYPLPAEAGEPIAHIALYSDNINKIPRDLSLVGPNQNIFRSGRPSFSEDPDYYKFTNTDGELFTVDPYSEEGERFLSLRDRVRDLDSGSQVTNASIKMSLRVNNNSGSTTQQWYPGTNTDLVTTIGTGQDLGLWDPSAIVPFNVAPVFYNYEDNPYIARINTSDFTVGETGPSPYAGKLWFQCGGLSGGLNYVAGSRNIAVEFPSDAPVGAGTGLQVAVWSITGAGIPNSISIDDEGEGWDLINASYPMTITNCKILAGDNNATFTLTVNKRGYGTVTNGVDLLDSITQNFDGATNTSYVNQEVGVTAGVTTSSSNGEGLKLNFTVAGGVITVLTVSDPGEGFIPGDTITLATGTYGGSRPAIITLKASDFNNMYPILTVYETEPLESKLDIYWETSTAGLISTLNTAIVSGGGSDPNTPSTLKNGSGGDVVSLVTEGTLIQGSTTNVTGDFTAYNAGGASLATEMLSTTLISALDRRGVDWVSSFATASGSGAGLFKITSNTGLYYGATSNSHHDWTFVVRVVVKSSTWALDGTTISMDLPLQGNPFRMLNVAPTFTQPAPFLGGSGSGTSAAGGNVFNAVATNGSGTTALKGLELNWSIVSVKLGGVDVSTTGYFTLTPDGTTQNAALDAIAGLSVGVYTVRLKVVDGGGLSKKSSVITITIT